MSKKQYIFRQQREKNFTNLNNEIFQEAEISLPAMGLLCYLLSKPITWETKPKHLSTILKKKEKSKASYNYILELLQELECAGYVKKKKMYTGNVEYFIYDFPNLENTNLGNNQIEVLATSEMPNLEIPKTNKEHIPNKEQKEEERKDDSFFLLWWKIYPRKRAKLEAQEEFESLTLDEQHKVFQLTKKFALDMENTSQEYILLPTTYLKQKRYNDYAEIEEFAAPNGGAKNSNYEFSKAEILAEKIKKLLFEIPEIERSKPLGKQNIYKLNEGQEIHFDNYELEVLNEMGMSLIGYEEIEFQDGEIRNLLNGAM